MARFQQYRVFGFWRYVFSALFFYLLWNFAKQHNWEFIAFASKWIFAFFLGFAGLMLFLILLSVLLLVGAMITLKIRGKKSKSAKKHKNDDVMDVSYQIKD